MRKFGFVFSVAVGLLLTAQLFAMDFSFSACTLDGKTATLQIVLNDDAIAKNPHIPATIENAFRLAANGMSANDLVGEKGFMAFVSNITDKEWDAIDSANAPAIDEQLTCK